MHYPGEFAHRRVELAFISIEFADTGVEFALMVIELADTPF